MTPEEQFDRMRERHQALAESVELLAAENRQFVAENRQFVAQTHQNFLIVLDSIKSLGRIAESHEHRIEGLEGQ